MSSSVWSSPTIPDESSAELKNSSEENTTEVQVLCTEILPTKVHTENVSIARQHVPKCPCRRMNTHIHPNPIRPNCHKFVQNVGAESKIPTGEQTRPTMWSQRPLPAPSIETNNWAISYLFSTRAAHFLHPFTTPSLHHVHVARVGGPVHAHIHHTSLANRTPPLCIGFAVRVSIY